VKKIVFSVILLLAMFVFCGAIAEPIVEMPFGLKWTESFTFQNEVQFGMTKEEVDGQKLDEAEYHYDDSGLLSSVVYKFPFKGYNSAYSDYADMENRLTGNYGGPLEIDLIYPGESVGQELSVSGESKHSNRIIIEGKNKLITIEHYLLGTLDPNNRDHYRILVYSRYEGNQYDAILYWHLKAKSIY
jgi:hypothetical protein